jgi:hypothetical protein
VAQLFSFLKVVPSEDGMGRVLGVSFCAVLGLAGAAAGQSVSSSELSSPSANVEFVPLSPQQEREVTKWLAAVEKWQRYDARWRNRPVHDGWARIAERKPPPPAPDWLEEYCASAVATGIVRIDERTMNVCHVVDDPRAAIRSVQAPAQTAQINAEKPPHSSFLSRIHLDGLWTTTSSGARFYGIIGSHMSLMDVGRLQVFGPPGVLLLTVPDENGGRRVTLGYTWGLSVRLGDVRLGAPTKNLTLFLNLSKVWLGSGEGSSPTARGFDIVGFSLAPRKKRR